VSDHPRHTPTPHDLFMACWQAQLFATGRCRVDIVHWGKIWIDCCELAGRLEELEAKAAEAEATDPEPWPPLG
jgi:hypothetical protein